MSAGCPSPGLTWFAILPVTAVTALAIAACGSSNTSSPTTSPSASPATTSTTASSTPPTGEAQVSGLIASVAGNAIHVTQNENDNTTVEFTPSTKVTEVTTAALTDVTAGSCITVQPAHEGSSGGQAVTAASVHVSAPVNGKCPQSKESAPGSSSTAPSGAPAKRAAIEGAIASVVDNTIEVTSTDASGTSTQTAVTVNNKTRYMKEAAATSQAITPGKCIAARGTKDSSGTLQATHINLRPANDGKCGGKPKEPHGGK